MRFVIFLSSLMFMFWLNSAGADDLAKETIRKEIKNLQFGINTISDFYICATTNIHKSDIVDLRAALHNNEQALDEVERASLKLIDDAIKNDQRKIAQLIKIAETAISKEAYGKVIQDAEAKLNMTLVNRQKLVEEINQVRDYSDDVAREEFANKEILLLPTRQQKIVNLREDFCSKISSLKTVASMLIDLYVGPSDYDFDKISFTLQGAFNDSVVYDVNVPVYYENNQPLDSEVFAIRFDIELIKKVFGDAKKAAIDFTVRQAPLDYVPLINFLPTEDVRFAGNQKIVIEYNKSKNRVIYPSKQQIEKVLFLMLGIKNEKLSLYKNNK